MRSFGCLDSGMANRRLIRVIHNLKCKPGMFRLAPVIYRSACPISRGEASRRTLVGIAGKLLRHGVPRTRFRQGPLRLDLSGSRCGRHNARGVCNHDLVEVSDRLLRHVSMLVRVYQVRFITGRHYEPRIRHRHASDAIHIVRRLATPPFMLFSPFIP